jgi:hypothetical protein
VYSLAAGRTLRCSTAYILPTAFPGSRRAWTAWRVLLKRSLAGCHSPWESRVNQPSCLTTMLPSSSCPCSPRSCRQPAREHGRTNAERSLLSIRSDPSQTDEAGPRVEHDPTVWLVVMLQGTTWYVRSMYVSSEVSTCDSEKEEFDIMLYCSALDGTVLRRWDGPHNISNTATWPPQKPERPSANIHYRDPINTLKITLHQAVHHYRTNIS